MDFFAASAGILKRTGLVAIVIAGVPMRRALVDHASESPEKSTKRKGFGRESKDVAEAWGIVVALPVLFLHAWARSAPSTRSAPSVLVSISNFMTRVVSVCAIPHFQQKLLPASGDPTNGYG
jgi:hypothetical protein